MNFFRGIVSIGASSSEPSPSVLEEWNKYSSGDVESRGADAAPQKPAAGASMLSMLQGVSVSFPGSTSAAGTKTAATTTPSMPTYVSIGQTCLL
jgi:hypothetical protein